jgi:hypothetical protein
MINYTWAIGPFDCILNEDNMQKVVTTVHWRYRGTDEDGITAEIYGAQAVGAPNPENFTPFLEITPEQAEGWLEAAMDMDAIKANIDSQINLIKNPVTATLPAPWNTPVVQEEVEEETVLDTEE